MESIPKIIHQVWIGDEAPQSIKDAMQSVRDKNPEFKYMLWDNNTIQEFTLKYLDGYHPAFISNLLRMHAISRYGGWYIDADVICNESILDLHNEYCNSDLVISEIINRQYKHTSAVMLGKKGYDFTEFLDSYIPDHPHIIEWTEFMKNRKKKIIPYSEVGQGSKILNDIRIGTWIGK